MTNNTFTILLVDDERDVIEALYDTLSYHYDVIMATSAKKAIEILKETPVDLIISDQRMPEITGVELFKTVNEDYPFIGKILLTGYSDQQATVDAINKGSVDKYLTKPWDDKELISIVLAVLNIRLRHVMQAREMIEKQLEQSSKMSSLGELVAGIVHEINNPLSFITSNLGNLAKFSKKIMGLVDELDQIELPPEIRKVFDEKKEDAKYSYLQTRIPEMIERSSIGAERMKKILLDVKNFSRADTDVFEPADINEALESVLGIMYHEYKNRIEIVREFSELPLVECTISRLNQVFMNILVNACHAIEDKGEIRIKTGVAGDMAVISLSDNGAGIPEEVRARIFEPFFTTKKAGKGTGLGLSISSGIVKRHNGTITVDSAPGKGTTFTISIPLKAAGAAGEKTED